METEQTINLHLPKSWNAMTTQEMELIAHIMICEQNRVSEKYPFDYDRVKIQMFLAITKLIVIETANPEKPVEEQFLLVCRQGYREEIIIYLWQIHYWINESMKWMDQPSTRTLFPYPEYKHRFRKFAGPGALMQNFKWRQYRISTEYMDYYVSQANRLIQMEENPQTSGRDLKKQLKATNLAKTMFLATIFNAQVKYMDTETLRVTKGYTYVSNQSISNLRAFRSFPDEKFQCVLFWWCGMMNYLQKNYPLVFKKQTSKKQEQVNPLELYTRTTATMEKYLGLKEEDVNRETFTVVLRHLNDMAEHAKEMEKLRK